MPLSIGMLMKRIDETLDIQTENVDNGHKSLIHKQWLCFKNYLL